MKLSPGRTSLSAPESDAGKIFDAHFSPQRHKVAEPAVIPAPPPRKCVMCAKVEVIQWSTDEECNVSSVTTEFRWLEAANEQVAKKIISGYLAARGWRYRFHLGRHGMERDICRPCLMAYQETAQEFARKKANELKSGTQSDNYYLSLCGD